MNWLAILAAALRLIGITLESAQFLTGVARVAALLKGHVRIAEYVDQFEQDPFNYVRRSQMVQAIAATYDRTREVE